MRNFLATRRSGFTLIELLVVIAIIAILAAILFPVFAQAKEAAKKTVCLSNTKQIALGVYMYTNDFDDVYPQNDWENEAAGGYPGTFNPQNPLGTYQVTWTYTVQPYIKSWAMFVCPSDPNPFPTDNQCPNGVSDIGKLNASGQMYCDWSAQKSSYIPVYNAIPAHDWAPVSGTNYASPSQQIVVTEHRNDSLVVTDAGDGDGHKGTSGFWPSQPCGNLNPSLSLPSPTTATKGNAASTSTGYTTFNPAFLTEAYTAAKAAGGIGTSKYVAFFKAYDAIRVAWDRHSSGQGANYSFADGHAKYQTLGAVLNPSAYEFGDRWYATQEPWNTGPCQ